MSYEGNGEKQLGQLRERDQWHNWKKNVKKVGGMGVGGGGGTWERKAITHLSEKIRKYACVNCD